MQRCAVHVLVGIVFAVSLAGDDRAAAALHERADIESAIATTERAEPSRRSLNGAPGRSPRGREAVARGQRLRKVADERRDAHGLWQLGLLATTLAACVDATRKAPRLSTGARAGLLAALAFLASASFLGSRLFDTAPGSIHLKDAYHYWMGARYFDELAYDGLYDCTLVVAAERGFWWLDDLSNARDLRSNEPRPTAELLARGRVECPRRFTPERWRAFGDDVEWFDAQLQFRRWRGLLNDHGYNPSPVWTMLARPVASVGGPEWLGVWTRIDLLLLAVAFASIGWAFGLEIACLSMIVWGTGWLWDERWVGLAFLRQLWFASVVVGVCCLKRGAFGAAGAALAVGSATRLFPALAALGLLATWSRASADPTRRSSLRRALVGFGAVGLGLVVLSASLNAGGVGSWLAFARNLSELRSLPSVNLVGLEPLLWRIDGTSVLWTQAATAIPESHVATPLTSLLVRIAGTLGFVFVAWRAIRDAEPWQAAAAALLLLPVLTAPAAYYMQVVVVSMLLAAARPRIAIGVVAACMGWVVIGIASMSQTVEFGLASVVALLTSLGVLGALAFGSDSVDQSGSHRTRRPALPE